ncbi:MAG TPA: hypothetical protein ENK18_24975 [Deltaproteobacteria bacterium]|nr:hypothetical protein [Deltaproteobacteria bacterium]
MVHATPKLQDSRTTPQDRPLERVKVHGGFVVGLGIASPVAMVGSFVLCVGLLAGGQGGTALLWGIVTLLLVGVLPVFATALVLAEGEG